MPQKRYVTSVSLRIDSEGYSPESMQNRWAEIYRQGLKMFGPGFQVTLEPEWEERIVETVADSVNNDRLDY